MPPRPGNPRPGVRLPPEAVARPHPVPVGASNIIPPKDPLRVARWPQCRGCGTAVEVAGTLCEACEHKPWLAAPKASIQTAPQPEPPYVREGNFRREDTNAEPDATSA